MPGSSRRLLLILLLLTACSFKTLYNNLDYFIIDYAEGLVSLDDYLYKKLDHKTNQFLVWHRQTQLSDYADWLIKVRSDIRPGLSVDEIHEHALQVEQYWKLLSARFSHEMIDLLVLLNKKQLDELYRNIEIKNEEFREKRVNISRDEEVELYEDRLFDMADMWLGHIDDEQEEIIRKAARQIRPSSEFRLKRHQQWHTGLKAILYNESKPDDKLNKLNKFVDGFVNTPDPDIEKNKAYNRKMLSKLAVKMLKTLSKEQIGYMKREIDGYARIFRELASENNDG